MRINIIDSARKSIRLIRNKYTFLKEEYRKRKYLLKPFGKKVYILGSPDYTNIGDSAITLAQINFIKECGISEERIKELTRNEYNGQYYKLLKSIKKGNLVCGVGGGNMGNIWPKEEEFRYDLIDRFRKNEIIIFPQTIYFIDNRYKNKDIIKSQRFYEQHKKLTLVAREKDSYKKMNELYKESKILLTPDIVLSADMSVFGVTKKTRTGVLLCMRDDIEKALSQEDVNKIKEILNNKKLMYTKTDMHSDCWINKENRYGCVKEKMNEFVRSKLVITDRLHGMVFAAITGTPCIVFSNYNHKVKGTYQWIKYLPYIKYVENVNDVEKLIPELLAMKDCKYDNTPLMPYFNKLSEVIKEKC